MSVLQRDSNSCDVILVRPKIYAGHFKMTTTGKCSSIVEICVNFGPNPRDPHVQEQFNENYGDTIPDQGLDHPSDRNQEFPFVNTLACNHELRSVGSGLNLILPLAKPIDRSLVQELQDLRSLAINLQEGWSSRIHVVAFAGRLFGRRCIGAIDVLLFGVTQICDWHSPTELSQAKYHDKYQISGQCIRLQPKLNVNKDK